MWEAVGAVAVNEACIASCWSSWLAGSGSIKVLNLNSPAGPIFRID